MRVLHGQKLTDNNLIHPTIIGRDRVPPAGVVLEEATRDGGLERSEESKHRQNPTLA